MKKVFFVLAALSVFTSSQAQVKFGTRGGINVTNIVGKDVDGYKAKPGFFIGGLVQVPVVSILSIQPEVFYSAQGAKWKGGGSTNLGYMQVPVLAKITTTSGFFAETGPQLGFLLNAKDDYDGEKEDIKSYLKTTDFSWAIGAGYNINSSIGVHARYNAGLTGFYEKEKNSVFQLGVQYIFGQSSK